MCKTGRKGINGEDLYTVCIEGSGCWNACQERNDKLNDGIATMEVWKVIGGELKCHWCGRNIYHDAEGYTNAVCDHGYIVSGEEGVKRYYHQDCFKSMREIFPNRCERCNKHFSVIYHINAEGKEVKENVCFNCLEKYGLHEVLKKSLQQ